MRLLPRWQLGVGTSDKQRIETAEQTSWFERVAGVFEGLGINAIASLKAWFAQY
jgi:hypothetical protein